MDCSTLALPEMPGHPGGLPSVSPGFLTIRRSARPGAAWGWAPVCVARVARLPALRAPPSPGRPDAAQSHLLPGKEQLGGRRPGRPVLSWAEPWPAPASSCRRPESRCQAPLRDSDTGHPPGGEGLPLLDTPRRRVAGREPSLPPREPRGPPPPSAGGGRGGVRAVGGRVRAVGVPCVPWHQTINPK